MAPGRRGRTPPGVGPRCAPLGAIGPGGCGVGGGLLERQLPGSAVGRECMGVGGVQPAGAARQLLDQPVPPLRRTRLVPRREPGRPHRVSGCPDAHAMSLCLLASGVQGAARGGRGIAAGVCCAAAPGSANRGASAPPTYPPRPGHGAGGSGPGCGARIRTPQRAGVSVSPMCINGSGMGLDPSMK